MSGSNLVILPSEYRGISNEKWASLLLGNESAEVEGAALGAHGKNKKRAKELLAAAGGKEKGCEFNNVMKKLIEPETLLLGLKSLEELLEFFDSAETDWHMVRGLPFELKGRKDIVAITHKKKTEFSLDYFQEYSILGLNETG